MINAAKIPLDAVVKHTIGNIIFLVYPNVHFSYSSIAWRKRRKEKIVCPNVFNTGTPRTYSTASEDIDSSAF